MDGAQSTSQKSKSQVLLKFEINMYQKTNVNLHSKLKHTPKIITNIYTHTHKNTQNGKAT